MLKKADKKLIWTIIAIILGLALILWLIPGKGGGSNLGRISLDDGHQIYVELAVTEREKAQGLSGRRALSDLQGMLFLYDEPRIPSFWMKHMHFDLDLIWIRGETVVDLSPDVPKESFQRLETFSPRAPVDRVLEVRAGFAERYGVEIGDTLTIELSE